MTQPQAHCYEDGCERGPIVLGADGYYRCVICAWWRWREARDVVVLTDHELRSRTQVRVEAVKREQRHPGFTQPLGERWRSA